MSACNGMKNARQTEYRSLGNLTDWTRIYLLVFWLSFFLFLYLFVCYKPNVRFVFAMISTITKPENMSSCQSSGAESHHKC